MAVAGRQRDGSARPLGDLLDALDTLLDDLAASVTSADVATAHLATASARLRVAGARADAARWALLPRIEAAGDWARTGARTFAVWLARTEDVQTLTARRDVRTARALRDHLPATLTAALDGRIGTDKLRALVDVATTSTPRTDALGAPAIDVPTVEPSPAPGVGSSSPGAAGPGEEGTGHDPTEPDVPGPDGQGSDGEGSDGEEPGRPELDGPAPAAPTWEEQLLDWSTQNGPDRFRGLVRYFARHADPDADERGYARAKDREYLDVSPTLGGYHVSGFLTEEHGQVLTTAIGSVMGAPAAGDDRTPGQRRGQALADLARIVLDHGRTGTGASIRPHLSVTVSWSELQALASAGGTGPSGTTTPRLPTAPGLPTGPGLPTAPGVLTPPGLPNPPGPPTAPELPTVPGLPTVSGPPTVPGTDPDAPRTGLDVRRPAVFTETGSPLPTSLLRRIACDSEVTRIVFGPDSQVLDVGRARRTVTGQLRRAVIARDKHCVLGECDQPPGRCEVHHATQHWADGGHTSVANAALLCYHHHDLVDTQGITMHYDNGWHFTDRHGHVVHARALPIR